MEKVPQAVAMTSWCSWEGLSCELPSQHPPRVFSVELVDCGFY